MVTLLLPLSAEESKVKFSMSADSNNKWMCIELHSFLVLVLIGLDVKKKLQCWSVGRILKKTLVVLVSGIDLTSGFPSWPHEADD
jgi:hypothetical protein